MRFLKSLLKLHVNYIPAVDRATSAQDSLRFGGSSEKNRRNQVLVRKQCSRQQSCQRQTGKSTLDSDPCFSLGLFK